MKAPKGYFLYLIIRNACFVLGVFFLLIFLEPISKYLSTSDWRSTEGTIVQSRKIPGQALFWGLHELTRIEIVYQYSVEGEVREGRRINFGIGSNTYIFDQFADRMVASYPVGKTMAVFYNPDNSEDEVLDRIPVMGFGLVWAIATVFFFAMSVLITFQKKAVQKAVSAPRKRSLRGRRKEIDQGHDYPTSIYNPPPVPQGEGRVVNQAEVAHNRQTAAADYLMDVYRPSGAAQKRNKNPKGAHAKLIDNDYPAGAYSPLPVQETVPAEPERRSLSFNIPGGIWSVTVSIQKQESLGN